jgi:hypothetical protein
VKNENYLKTKIPSNFGMMGWMNGCHDHDYGGLEMERAWGAVRQLE